MRDNRDDSLTPHFLGEDCDFKCLMPLVTKDSKQRWNLEKEKGREKESGWMRKEREEEVGEREAWRLKKEAAGHVMDMGHAGLFAHCENHPVLRLLLVL